MGSVNIAKRVLCGYWVLIFLGTHLPGPAVERIKRHKEWPFRGFGFVMHTLMYGGWAALWLWVLWRARRGRIRAGELAGVWFLAACYSIFDEVTQLLVGRTGKVSDVIVDLWAVAMVFAVGLLIAERRRSTEPVVG
jgi:hypothetical protein